MSKSSKKGCLLLAAIAVGGVTLSSAAACLLAVAFESGDDSGSSGPPALSSDEKVACGMCRRFVEKKLSHPDEATHGLCRKAIIERVEGSERQWTVMSEVQSKNAFGVRKTFRYTCTMTDEGDKWTLDNRTLVERK